MVEESSSVEERERVNMVEEEEKSPKNHFADQIYIGLIALIFRLDVLIKGCNLSENDNTVSYIEANNANNCQ